MRYYHLILSAVFIFTVKSSYAFDPVKHRDITLQAFVLFEQCNNLLPQLNMPFSQTDRQQIANTTRDIDALTVSRLLNWHFYDLGYNDKTKQVGTIKPRWGLINRSLHKHYLDIYETLKAKTSVNIKQDVTEEVGELMHFIQDMAVPAHVMPIFHVYGLSDPFDSYEPESMPLISIDQSTCQSFLDDKSTAVDILRNSAEQTLKTVKQQENNRSPWHNYWLPNSKTTSKDGFGRYGICGRKGFGISAQKPCDLTEVDYDRFYIQQHRAAVHNSVRLLFHLYHLTLNQN